jgi:hypothetical protein
MVALLDIDSNELPADLGRNANLGCSHHADESRVLFAAPKHVSAYTKRDENEAKHGLPAAKHATASAL